MQKNPFQDDPTSNWPEEVKRAYEQLEIPSLYDSLLANEKLSLELRKQNKEVKTIQEELQHIQVTLNSLVQIFNEDLEIYDEEEAEGYLLEGEEREFENLEFDLLEAEQEELQKNSKQLLIDTTDSIVDLSKITKQLIAQLMDVLSQQPTDSSSMWYKIADTLTQSVIDHVDQTRYKLMTRLNEWQIQMIEPQIGEMFDETNHHVLEQTAGGLSGSIAKVIRAGYKQNDKILRLADVVVYI